MTSRIKFTIAAAALSAATLFGAGSAVAQEATPDTWLQQSHSTKSRADVRAELAAARASGQMLAFRAGYIEPVKSSRLRAQVRADTLSAMASGELKAIGAEVADPGAPVRAAVRLAGR